MNWQDCVAVTFDPATCSNLEIIAFCKAWRNKKLAESDYTQLPDVDLTNKFDWAVYRQELRDLPQQGSDPKLWVFPDPPK